MTKLIITNESLKLNAPRSVDLVKFEWSPLSDRQITAMWDGFEYAYKESLSYSDYPSYWEIADQICVGVLSFDMAEETAENFKSGRYSNMEGEKFMLEALEILEDNGVIDSVDDYSIYEDFVDMYKSDYPIFFNLIRCIYEVECRDDIEHIESVVKQMCCLKNISVRIAEEDDELGSMSSSSFFPSPQVRMIPSETDSYTLSVYSDETETMMNGVNTRDFGGYSFQSWGSKALERCGFNGYNSGASAFLDLSTMDVFVLNEKTSELILS